MTRIKVTPRKGLQIRHPITLRHLPAEGLEVDDGTFWRRLERSGDVVIQKVAQPATDVSPSGAPELGPDDLQPVTPLTTRDLPPGVPQPAPREHTERRGGTPDSGDDR